MKIPVSAAFNEMIHLWCKWCVATKKVVPLQNWMGYTHDMATNMVIIRACSDSGLPRYEEDPA